jgi:hypothetical protein
LAGFIEGDGHFAVRASATSSSKKINSPKIECRFELAAKTTYLYDGLRHHNGFMEYIAIFLGCSVGEVISNSKFL